MTSHTADLNEEYRGIKPVGSMSQKTLCDTARVFRDVVDTVGFTADLAGFMATLETMVGMPKWKEKRANKAKGKNVPPPAMMAALTTQMRWDSALYAHLLEQNATGLPRHKRTGAPPGCVPFSPTN